MHSIGPRKKVETRFNTLHKEYALGLLTVLFWSTSATAFKITLQYLDVLQLLLYSIITAVAVLGVFLGAKGQLGNLPAYLSRNTGVQGGYGNSIRILRFLQTAVTSGQGGNLPVGKAGLPGPPGMGDESGMALKGQVRPSPLEHPAAVLPI